MDIATVLGSSGIAAVITGAINYSIIVLRERRDNDASRQQLAFAAHQVAQWLAVAVKEGATNPIELHRSIDFLRDIAADRRTLRALSKIEALSLCDAVNQCDSFRRLYLTETSSPKVDTPEAVSLAALDSLVAVSRFTKIDDVARPYLLEGPHDRTPLARRQREADITTQF